MSEQKLEVDTVKLLRAVMKISSALNDYDNIVFQKKYFKYKFKLIGEKWCKSMLLHTDNLMKSLNEEDDELLMEVYTSIDKSTDQVSAGSDEKTSLILFYTKLKSAMNDISEMNENRNTFYPEFIYRYTNKVVKELENQYNSIIQTKDNEGKGPDTVISYLDDLGKKIMHMGETNKED